MLAHLEDGLFENLPEEAAQAWPERFLTAVPVGADLSGVWPRFAVWLLTDPEWGVLRFATTERVRKVIQDVSDLYGRVVGGGTVADDDFARAAGAAWAAQAAGAAWAAEAAWAAWAARAAEAARAAGAAWAAGAQAAGAAWAAGAQADKLIELLEGAPVPSRVG